MSRLPIQDEFSKLPISRQRKYQLRKQKAGRCVQCGKPAVTSYRCAFHLVAAREYLRKFTGARKRYKTFSYVLEAAIKATPAKAVPTRPAPPRGPSTISNQLSTTSQPSTAPKPKRGIQDEFTYLPISNAEKSRLRKQRDAEWRAKYFGKTSRINP